MRNLFFLKSVYAILALCLFSLSTLAQSLFLESTIGLSSLPNDNDAVCTIPFSNPPGGFNFQGQLFQVGDTIPDFTLYQLDGTPVTLSDELLKGKPVLLVTISITCFISRNRMVEFNNLFATYGNDVNFYLVYVVEAHPQLDISPYTISPGSVWCECGAGGANQYHVYRQPTIYSEKKTIGAGFCQ